MMNDYSSQGGQNAKNQIPVESKKEKDVARINHKYMTVGMMNDISEQREDEDDGENTPKMSERKVDQKSLIRPTVDSDLIMN